MDERPWRGNEHATGKKRKIEKTGSRRNRKKGGVTGAGFYKMQKEAPVKAG